MRCPCVEAGCCTVKPAIGLKLSATAFDSAQPSSKGGQPFAETPAGFGQMPINCRVSCRDNLPYTKAAKRPNLKRCDTRNLPRYECDVVATRLLRRDRPWSANRPDKRLALR